MVDRYRASKDEFQRAGSLVEDRDGDAVLYSDYEALEAKLARLVSECERVLQNMPLYGYNLEPREILRDAISAAKEVPRE